jgi:glucose-6-phosphate isomerase
MSITISDSLAKKFISESSYEQLQSVVVEKHKMLTEQIGAGNEFLGWLDLPERMLNDNDFWDKASQISQSWTSKNITHIVVIGIGGSYLGSKAIYEALGNPFGVQGKPELIFAGHHMSADYLDKMCQFLKNVSFGLIVISKSGTTLEPALAFRILRTLLSEAYGQQEADRRIVSITDASKGALRQLTNETAWPSFIIEDSVGGRYSVLSPVGIIPLLLAGYDVKALLEGALEMQHICHNETHIEKNPALKYAALRYLLYESGKQTELLASFQPEFQYFAEWWKQLFGESDGKGQKGIFPASVVFSTDLHSMGQYIQEGLRTIFETFIIFTKKPGNMVFPSSKNDEDGLNYLAGRPVAEVNNMAEQATMLAHMEGDVPVIGILTESLNPSNLGQLIYFFEFACAIGGYLLGVNPFDQPGVEAYKKNMFALLGKPGMENETKEILRKLEQHK